jgi:tRNA pseudouridine38-40 synthase
MTAFQRKMIGFAVLLTRSQGSPSLVDKAYEFTRIHIPKAPALGLLLEEPVFSVYNSKIETANAKWRGVAATNGKGKASGKGTKAAKDAKDANEETDEDKEHAANFIRDPIDFSKYKDTIEEFKKNYIYEQMQKTEEEQGT